MEAVLLCERTGWTLDYVRSLSDRDFLLVDQTLGALDEFRHHQNTRASERRR